MSALADDESAPPLTRRVPGAARSGPGQASRAALPDALLQRMQAAVDAERARSPEAGSEPDGTSQATAASQPGAQRAGQAGQSATGNGQVATTERGGQRPLGRPAAPAQPVEPHRSGKAGRRVSPFRLSKHDRPTGSPHGADVAARAQPPAPEVTPDRSPPSGGGKIRVLHEAPGARDRPGASRTGRPAPETRPPGSASAGPAPAVRPPETGPSRDSQPPARPSDDSQAGVARRPAATPAPALPRRAGRGAQLISGTRPPPALPDSEPRTQPAPPPEPRTQPVPPPAPGTAGP
ncbi:MAG: hypothetical protein ACR2FU_14755, partial [Streptosporangiaceae bacterium]